MAAALSLRLDAPSSEAPNKAIGAMNALGTQDPRYAARVEHYLADHGLNHPQRLDTHGASPLAVAERTLTQELRAGRTVMDWTKLASAQSLLALEPQAAAQPRDLAFETARLDALAGIHLDAAQQAEVARRAAALPADVRAPFAQLVGAVADAYAAQAPVAQDVLAQTRAAHSAGDMVMPDEAREATLENAMGIVAAQNAFRDAAARISFPQTQAALFRDPAGLVILGSLGNDVYERTGALRDPILLVDPAGDDVYHTTAGAACPDLLSAVHDCNGLVASVLVDLAGDDTYDYAGPITVAQGSAGQGGIGILVDAAGNDSYRSLFTQGRGYVYLYITGGAQGYGFAATGILLDAAGNDVYEADVTTSHISTWDLAQGFGNAGGVGIAADGGGDDQWLSYGFDNGLDRGEFQGLYPGGTGFFGGVGVLADTGASKDEYHAWDNASTTDFYAYGFAAFGGTGIFLDDGGDDNYQAVESATDPFIVPLLNCAYGTGSYAGLGVFLEMGGNDHYFGDTVSPRSAWTMNEGFGGPAAAEGVFVDVSGDDGHFMQVHGGPGSYTAGRGILLGGGEGLFGNTVGAYLDLAGNDQYTGAAPSHNNAAWPVGADFEAGGVPDFFVN